MAPLVNDIAEVDTVFVVQEPRQSPESATAGLKWDELFSRP